MNKKVIFIGLGVLILGGAAFFLLRKKPSVGGSSSDTGAGERSAESAGDQDYSDEASSVADIIGREGTKKEVRQERRQTRRDCRAEAKSQGLRGREKRQFRRKCKSEGGVDDGADFAFNGFGGDIDNLGY